MPETKNSKTIIKDVALINARSVKNDFSLSEIQYIDISSVGTGQFTETLKTMPFSDAPSRARRLVQAGDTIISTVRPNRRSFIFLGDPKQNTVVSTGFAVLTPTPKIDPRYLYYWISRQEFSD
jgi:type I restriction enzyme, S subunit